jgi:hypothetical protein
MAAATAAIAGLAISGVSAGMSFAQAAKSRKDMNAANEAAALAMAEARKRLDVNVFDQLSVFDRVYKEAQEQSRGQAMQAMQMSQEADQGAVATAGKLQAMQNEQQNQIAMAHGMKLEELDKLSATEEGRLRDIGTQIDLAEAEGAQKMSADAQKQMAASMGQGFSSVAQGMQYGAQLVPLYMQTQAGKTLDAQMGAYNQAAAAGTLGNQFMDSQTGKYMPYQQAMATLYPDASNLTGSQWNDFMGGQDKSFIQQYNPLGVQQQQSPQQRQQAEMFMRGTLGQGNENQFAPYNTGFNPYFQPQKTEFDMIGGYSPYNSMSKIPKSASFYDKYND